MSGMIQRAAIIGVFLVSLHFPLSTALAGSLEPWRGSFVSQDAFLDSPAFGDFYAKVVESARKQGKQYTIDGVKAFFKSAYRSDFAAMTIAENTITFYDGVFERPIETRTYRYMGEKQTHFGKKPITWHAFQAVGEESGKSGFRHIVLLEIRPGKKAVPHFHLRYGQELPEELVKGEAFQRWWPVYLYRDFDLIKLVASKNPDQLSKLLP